MKAVFPLLLFFLCSPALCRTFELPRGEFDLFGYVTEISANYEDTLLDIARRYSIGQEEILLANPHVDRWLPGTGATVTVPSRYILPDVSREGLILNLPEMRIYYFPPSSEEEDPRVMTFPVSIGRVDWQTPQGETKVSAKQEDPPWYPPESIRAEHAAQGDPLPRMVPPGPDNPLGRHAIRLNIPGYLIHGTNKPFGVGMRVSHGCIRMLPEDVAKLFAAIETGTPVHIINQPVKAGWYGGELFIEIHPPLEELPMTDEEIDDEISVVLDRALSQRAAVLDEQAIREAITKRSGMPTVISAPD